MHQTASICPLSLRATAPLFRHKSVALLLIEQSSPVVSTAQRPAQVALPRQSMLLHAQVPRMSTVAFEKPASPGLMNSVSHYNVATLLGQGPRIQLILM